MAHTSPIGGTPRGRLRPHSWLALGLCALLGAAPGCGNVSLQLDPGSTGSVADGGDGSDDGDDGGDAGTLTILRTVVESPSGASSSINKSLHTSKADTPTAGTSCTLMTMSGTVLATATSNADGYCDFQITPGSVSNGDTVLITATVGGATLSLVATMSSSPTIGTTTSLGTTGPSSSVVAQMIFTSCESASGRTVTTSDPSGCATANSAGDISLLAMVNAMNQLRTISEASGSTDTATSSGAFGAMLSNFRSAIGSGSGAQYLRTAIDDSNYASLKQTVLATQSVLTDATLISNVNQGGNWATVANCLASWGSSDAAKVVASPAMLRNLMKNGSAESGGLDFCKSGSGAKAVAAMSGDCGSQSDNAALYSLVKAGSWASVESCNASVMGSAICNLAKSASDNASQTTASNSASSLMSSVLQNPLAFAGTTGTTVASRMLYMGSEGYTTGSYTFCRSNSDCGSGKLCSIANTCVSDTIPVGSNLALGLLCDSDAKCASGNCSSMVSSGDRFCAPANGFVVSTSSSLPPPDHDVSLPPVDLSIGSCLEAPATEAVAPAVLATNPVCGTNGFSTNQTFRITFNQPMDAATITSSTVAVVSQDGAVTGTVSTSGTSALFTPAAALQNGLTYTLTASTGVKNADGTALSAPFSCAMTTVQAAPTGLFVAYDSAVVLRGGRVWAWGRNQYGQLGGGTIKDSNSPQPVPNLYGVQQVSVCSTHTLALKTDGTVWAWGSNRYGQLGDGTTTDHLTPAIVPGLANVSEAWASSAMSAALKSDGTVWTWGNNSSGQLGNNTVINASTPVQVVGSGGSGFLTNVSDIACGGGLGCYALKPDGSVWSWGNGVFGRLGDGTTVSKSYPVQVKGVGGVGTLSGVSKIFNTALHAMALLNNGTVVGWGYNSNGQLGNGNTTQQTTPAVVTGLTGVNFLSAGVSHSLAVKNDGTVWGWGLGTAFGTSGNVTSATQVSGITNVVAASAGNNFSVFQESDNSMKAVGSSLYGHLGDGATVMYNSKGNVHSNITGVTKLGGGACDVLHAFTPNTKWYAWGRNADREILPDTDPAYQAGWASILYPAFSGSPNPQFIASGCYFTLALMADGTVRSWGRNSSGQLGDGGTSPHTDHTTAIVGLSNVTQINPGRDHSLVLKDDGTAWTFGGNSYKQIGDGGTSSRLSPYQVAIATVVDAAASYHSLAVKGDGTVWAWGLGTSGQLGNGASVTQGAPVQVVGSGGSGLLTGVSKVGIGRAHSVVIKTDGTVWAWGTGAFGNLGNGTWVLSSSPVQVSGLTNVTKVCKNSTGDFSAVIKSDGTVWAWGDNTYGQLGCGDTANRNIPTQVLDVDGVTPITDAIDVACGGGQMAVLTQDGRVIEWGYKSNTSSTNPAGINPLISTLLDVVWP